MLTVSVPSTVYSAHVGSTSNSPPAAAGIQRLQAEIAFRLQTFHRAEAVQQIAVDRTHYQTGAGPYTTVCGTF